MKKCICSPIPINNVIETNNTTIIISFNVLTRFGEKDMAINEIVDPKKNRVLKLMSEFPENFSVSLSVKRFGKDSFF